MIKIKKIKPLFNTLVTTMDKYEADVTTNGLLLDMKQRSGEIKEYQTVVAVGDTVRGIKVGDIVSINPMRFAIKKHKEGSLKDGIVTDNPVVEYQFDVLEMEDTQYLYLRDSDINYIIEDYEEVEEPTSSFILPEEKKIHV